MKKKLYDVKEENMCIRADVSCQRRRAESTGPGSRADGSGPGSRAESAGPESGMESAGTVSRVRVEGIRDFDLDHIFDCGQCFRWSRENDGSYTGIAMGRVVNMQYYPAGPQAGSARGPQAGLAWGPAGDPAACGDPEAGEDPEVDVDPAAGGTLVIENCTEKEFWQIWHDYLDLGRDYGAVKEVLARQDDAMSKACSFGHGIRILKQDLWETIVSFIISQNNNIPRIRGCIEALAGGFGASAGCFRGREYFNLPEAKVLADLEPEDLADCRLGYREPYLIKTARSVAARGGADALACELAGSADPAGQLMELAGIGPKVANCIALFGAGRCDAFPVDVWMRRVMHQLYGIDEKDVKAMGEYARTHFAPYGGIAQQYLFYYIRSLNS